MAFMIADFLKRLVQPEPEELPLEDCRLALAALLVRIARSDGHYDENEVARIDAILSQRYGLSPFEGTKLRREAEEVEAQAPDTVRFTRAIKECVPFDERLGVIEALWTVVLADGVREEEENALLRMVAPMLGVSDVESAQARQKVERRA